MENSLVLAIDKHLKINTQSSSIPPQGMDGSVFFIKDKKNHEYAVKLGNNIDTDIKAYQLLIIRNINIPIPKVYANFKYEDKEVCT